MSTEIWTASRVQDFLRDAVSYSPRARVRARRLAEDVRWNTANGSQLSARAGDWQLQADGQTWVVAAEIFDRTYLRVWDDNYRKIASVDARQLSVRANIETLEGVAGAYPGDWLVRNMDGDVWPIADQDFRRRYARE